MAKRKTTDSTPRKRQPKLSTQSAERDAAADFNPPAPTDSVAPLDETAVRRRAYELYEERGRQDGGAEGDWIRAENELKGR